MDLDWTGSFKLNSFHTLLFIGIGLVLVCHFPENDISSLNAIKSADANMSRCGVPK